MLARLAAIGAVELVRWTVPRRRFVAQVGAGAAGIAVAWRTFGTGGTERFDPAPTIERFVRCGRPEWRVNDHFAAAH